MVEIEGSYPVLEECGVGLFGKRFHQDRHGFVVVSQLHDVALMLYEAGLEIRVGIDDLDKCVAELRCVATVEDIYPGNVILGGVAVHLPIEEHATLVLGDGIIVVLAFRPELRVFLPSVQTFFLLLAVDESCHLVDGRMLHDVFYGHLYLEFIEDSYGKAHGSEGVESHGNEIAGSAELVMLQHPGSDGEKQLLLLGDGSHLRFFLYVWGRQCLDVHLAVRSQRHLVELHVNGRHHEVGQGLRHEHLQCIGVYGDSSIIGGEKQAEVF